MELVGQTTNLPYRHFLTACCKLTAQSEILNSGKLILTKLIELPPPDGIFRSSNALNSISDGFYPRPRRRSLQRSFSPLAGLQGPTSKGQGWEEKMRERKGEKKGRGERKKKKEPTPQIKSGSRASIGECRLKSREGSIPPLRSPSVV